MARHLLLKELTHSRTQIQIAAIATDCSVELSSPILSKADLVEGASRLSHRIGLSTDVYEAACAIRGCPHWKVRNEVRLVGSQVQHVLGKRRLQEGTLREMIEERKIARQLVSTEASTVQRARHGLLLQGGSRQDESLRSQLVQQKSLQAIVDTRLDR